MLTTKQQELASAWDGVAEWTVYVLMPEGLECVALIPVGRKSLASEWIIRREARGDDPRRRALAAMLAGRVDDPDPDLLGELFDLEARRLRETPHEGEAAAREAMLEAATVGSRIVDAAALWCRLPALRRPGLEVLRHIVEAAVAGEGWTNLERAAIRLALYGEASDREVLDRLRRLFEVNGEGGGGRLVMDLLAGDMSALEEDAAALSYGERAAAEYVVAGEGRDALDRLLEAAEEFERG